jgi:hypothetical protein
MICEQHVKAVHTHADDPLLGICLPSLTVLELDVFDVTIDRTAASVLIEDVLEPPGACVRLTLAELARALAGVDGMSTGGLP